VSGVAEVAAVVLVTTEVALVVQVVRRLLDTLLTPQI
tara:strand:- start:1430 stop:1540 length:111 start_codon:yes stop_codon:yes gene_type:complete